MKVHIPNNLYEKAKQIQREYRKQGHNRPLYECLQELENGFMGGPASVEEIKKAVEEVVKSHIPKNSGRNGRWLG